MRLSRTTAVVFLMLSQTPQPVAVIADRLAVRGELLEHSEIRAQLLRLATAELITRVGGTRAQAYALATSDAVEEALDEAWRILYGQTLTPSPGTRMPALTTEQQQLLVLLTPEPQTMADLHAQWLAAGHPDMDRRRLRGHLAGLVLHRLATLGGDDTNRLIDGPRTQSVLLHAQTMIAAGKS